MKKPSLIITLSVLVAGAVGLFAFPVFPNDSDTPNLASNDKSGSLDAPDGKNPASVPTAIPKPTPTPTPIPTPTPTPSPIPTPTPALPKEATLVFTGDILSHGPVIQRAAYNATSFGSHDYTPMFTQVRSLLEEADLAICHLETPVSSDNQSLSCYPIFNAPQELSGDLKEVGYDGCSTASNHSMDKGPNGVRSTLTQLENADLVWAGMARSAEEQKMPALYAPNGILIGHMSYTYGLNGFVLPTDEPYLVNVIDEEKILSEAARLRSVGVGFIILSVQWGNEYQVNPSEAQERLAESLLNSPNIDLIVGSHVHVVQPIGKFNDKYVIYGLGNFLSNQSANCCPAASQNGVMIYVDIVGTDVEGYKVESLTFEPTRVDRSDYTIVPLSRAVNNEQTGPNLRSFYQEVIDETSKVLNSLGGTYQIRTN